MRGVTGTRGRSLKSRLWPAWGWLLAAFLCSSGCDNEHAFSPAGHRAYELSLATLDTGLAVAWHGGVEGDALWLRFADASGQPLGSLVRITDGMQAAYEPDLQPYKEGFLLGWYEKNLDDGSLTALVARLDAQGKLQWRRELSAAGANGRNTVVRPDGDAVLVAWIESPPGDGPGVWSARLDAAGNFSIPPGRRAAASVETWNLNAAVDSGTLRVVYDAELGTQAKELQLLSIGPDGDAALTPLSADDGHDSSYPDLAISGGNAALTWFDARDGATQVYLATGSLKELATDLGTHTRRVSPTAGPSIGAYLAWNGERIGLAWCDTSFGQYELFTQTFDARGVPLSTAQRQTRTAAQSSIPSIRAWRQGFAVAWNEYEPQTSADTGHASIASSAAQLRLSP